MRFRRQPLSLESSIHTPVFDHKLCTAVLERIHENTPLDDEASVDLAVKIAVSIGHLCAAFEQGFVNEISADVGNEDYSVVVYLAHDTQPTI